MNMDLFEPLDEDELAQLDQFLLDLEAEDSMLSISELDGFLAAIVAGPDTLPPSKWLKAVWGGDGEGPEWESEAEFTEVFQAMIRHMNSIAALLNDAPEHFDAFFMYREMEGKTYRIVDEWCVGFVKAMQLNPKRWDDMPDAMTTLAPIFLFADVESKLASNTLDNMSDEEIEACQDLIVPAVREVHSYWRQRRSAAMANPPVVDEFFPSMANEPFRRQGEKIGRNDPCSCGSGKKYKRCCGLH